MSENSEIFMDEFKHSLKCRMCFFYAAHIGLTCSNVHRMTPSRFPIIGKLMPKDEGGWLKLGYNERGTCKFYVHRDGAIPVDVRNPRPGQEAILKAFEDSKNDWRLKNPKVSPEDKK